MFEADGLVVAGWRTNVAQRQPVFYQGCPSPALASTQHEGEFADRAIEGLRVQMIDSDRHPCHTHMARLGQRALPDSLERPGESAQPPYVMDRSSNPGRSCDACGNREGDVPPLPLQAERISLGTPPAPIPQERRVYGIFRTRRSYIQAAAKTRRIRNWTLWSAADTGRTGWPTEMRPGDQSLRDRGLRRRSVAQSAEETLAGPGASNWIRVVLSVSSRRGDARDRRCARAASCRPRCGP